MFWNRKDEPFIDERDFNYPKVLIKTPHKDIEGYIKEVDFDYLDERSKVFIVHAEREHPITRERIGTLFGVSIKEVEANDWYMKITHDGQTLYETVTKNTKPNLLEIKLKDTDSVPEVYYKGERLDESPKGLVDVSYHWKTDDFTNDDRGANDITVEYYDSHNNKYLDRKIIGHKRDM
ncbi:hypothetical protein E0T49_002352 [Enterococcus faecium]|uniref:hypothetical protein n=1 Tax=Enterococcus faecium TaxID=1352 RepID=UPI0002A35957|nr:hypothetical protein [Enterococcus faecium]EGP5080543.1 hypothetical protein [Enterococcus faecium]EGP5096694.1 hypothetical protein [Enterococcus faecium]ELB26608.1 hypothetical protein OIW_02628 [Enterococcus faecium EnGen0040]EME5381147.1 hypothetical protein [Enterococcus faecium]MCU2097656.1 hypothetical protein [Enterococcus faecium]